jgi:flagellar basal body P-ring formation protein FlgA
MMRIASSLVIGAFASLLMAGTALAEGFTLRADILVRSDVVTLGDLIDGLGERGGVSVFAAPGLGRSGTIQAVRILDAARENGIDNIEVGDITQVTIRRAGRLLSAETVSDTVAKAIIGEYGLPDTLTLTLDQGDGFYVEPDARIGLRVRSLDLDQRSGRFKADLVSYGAISGQSFKVTGMIADEIDVPVVAKDIARNAPVDVSDVVIEKRPRSELADNTIYDPAALAQMIVTRPFRKGDTLRQSDLAPMPMVTRGDLVTLIVEIPGMTLSTRGKAIQGGTAGAVISVQNLQTKRTLSGIIAGPGKVIVSVNQAAERLASAP